MKKKPISFILTVLAMIVASSYKSLATDSGFMSLAIGNTCMPPQDTSWQITIGPTGQEWSGPLSISSNGEIFTGTYAGGVFRSTDSGENWELAGLAAKRVELLSIRNNGDIYAAIYEDEYLTNVSTLFRSEDNGASWEEIEFPNFNISAIVFNTEGHIFISTWVNGGVRRSIDNGATWIGSGLGNQLLRGLVFNKAQNSLFALTPQNGIYRSINGGLNWENVGLGDVYLNNIAVNQEGHLFVGSDTGLYHSTNNGEDWTLFAFPDTDARVLGINNSGHIFANAIFQFVEGHTFRTIDNGATWDTINPPSYISGFAFNNNDYIFARAVSGEVIRSLDNGDTWSEFRSGLANTRTLDLAINDNNRLVAGHWGGLSISDDAGESWETIPITQLGFVPFYVAANNEGHIFTTGFVWAPIGLFRSTDNGETWVQINAPNSSFPLFINENGQIFTGGTNGNARDVLRSTDNGETWTPLGLSIAFLYDITAITANNFEGIFVGTGEGTIYRSLDDGDTWSSTNLTNSMISALAVNGQGAVFAGSDEGKLFSSSDNGETWAEIGHLNGFILDIIFHPEGAILAATENLGIFISADNGDNWYPFNQGLGNVKVTGLVMDTQGNLFAGTNGDGVFKYGGTVTSVKGSPAAAGNSAVLLCNYPNPSFGTTTIFYQLDQTADVELFIYDLYGRQVGILVSGRQTAGEYSVVFDGKDLPKGVYLCGLQLNRQRRYWVKIMVQ